MHRAGFALLAPTTGCLGNQQDHQVTPSAAVLAHDLERQLRAIHDALASLERNMKHQQRGSTARTDALELASQEGR